MTDPIVPPIDSENLKRCTKCGEWKPRESFDRNTRRRDGLHTWCKSCKSAYNRAYKAAHLERIVQRSRERYAANIEAERQKARDYYYANHDKVKRRTAQYRAANADKIKDYLRAYYAANTDKAKDYQREYDRTHRSPTKWKVKNHRRRARKLSLPSMFSAADWQAALDRFGGCCAACGRPPGLWHTLAADHWIPLSSPDCPGTVPWNIVPLCHGVEGCNNSKGHREAADWLAERFGPRKGRSIQRHIEAWLNSRH